MEEAQGQGKIASAFPAPPPFWKAFTSENLNRISELRTAQSSASKNHDPSKQLPLRILDLPTELRFLQPPEQPVDGHFRCFGDPYSLEDRLPSLEERGMQQLYTPPSSPGNGTGKHIDRAFILKRLAKSLLLNFLELVGIMSMSPEKYPDKLDDLNSLFLNFHHLLNEYRPHQARESLIMMMRDQLEKSRAETNGIREMKGKVESILKGLGQAKLAENVDMEDKDVQEEKEDGEESWAALWNEYGS